MDSEQYDLALYLMSDHALRARREALQAAQRVERHRPDGEPEAFVDELSRIDTELKRRLDETEAPF